MGKKHPSLGCSLHTRKMLPAEVKKNGEKMVKKQQQTELKLVSIGQTLDTVMESPVQTLTVVPGQLKGLLLAPKLREA